MTRLFLIGILVTVFAACNEPAGTTKIGVPKDTAAPVAPGKPTAAVKQDPVCEMPYEPEWTEFTVYNNDTIRFCSEQCKNAFLAKPEKYTKKM